MSSWFVSERRSACNFRELRRAAWQAYVVVDVPEHFLRCYDEVCHFPYCLQDLSLNSRKDGSNTAAAYGLKVHGGELEQAAEERRYPHATPSLKRSHPYELLHQSRSLR